MRKLLAVYFLLAGPICFAQAIPGNYNLVPNGGFELLPKTMNHYTTSTLGTQYLFDDTSFLNSPTCWVKGTANRLAFVSDSGASPSSPHASPPAHSGQYSLAMYQYYPVTYRMSSNQVIDTTNTGPSINVRYASVKLLKPLSAGKTYKFTMYLAYFKAVATNTVSLSTDRPMIIGNIGVHFSTNNIASGAIIGRLNVTPQIRFTSWPTPVIDSFAYAKLSATYTAQGGERYMTIGNFDYYNQLRLLHVAPDWLALQGYSHDTLLVVSCRHYIDDVSLVADTTQAMISPTAFSLGPDTNICTASTYTIGGEPGFLSYLWNTGDTTRLKTITSSGKYWCTIDNGCKQYTDTILINLGAPPTAFHISDSALCTGKPYRAFAPRGFTKYAWSNGSTADSADFSVAGTHWVRITSVCGTSFTDTFKLVNTSGTIPGININSHPPIILCDGTATIFVTNIVNGGPAPTYQWYKNDVLIPGATSGTYPDSLLVDGDTITVALYSSASCPITQPTISNHVGVTVYPNLLPAVSITASPDSIANGGAITFIATPVNGGPTPTYIWYLNGVPIPYDTTNTWIAYNLKNGDAVSVRMESSVPCPVSVVVWSASKMMHNYTTGVGNVNTRQMGVALYPNPVTATLTLELSTLSKDGQITLSDAVGRMVFSAPVCGVKSYFDLGSLAEGIYIYRVVLANGQFFIGKLIKQ